MSESDHKLVDWRPSDWDWKTGVSVGILAQDGQIFEEPEYYEDELPKQIASELQDLTQAARVHVAHIDPTVGAGSNGLGFLLQFLDVSADVITWGMLVSAAPKLRKAIGHLRRRFTAGGATVGLSFTAEALQVLVLAEVCSRHHLDPLAIVQLKCLSHEPEPPEPAVELQQLYSAHTIVVEAFGEDNYYHAWVYTVSPHGKVLFESDVRVPIPNRSQWAHLETTAGRLLDGIE